MALWRIIICEQCRRKSASQDQDRSQQHRSPMLRGLLRAPRHRRYLERGQFTSATVGCTGWDDRPRHNLNRSTAQSHGRPMTSQLHRYCKLVVLHSGDCHSSPQASTPPSSWYTDPRTLPLEEATVFRNSWLVRCHYCPRLIPSTSPHSLQGT